MTGINFEKLEAANVAQNDLLWKEGVGLPIAASELDAPSTTLEHYFQAGLDAPEPLLRAFAVDGWLEARHVPLEARVAEAMDAVLRVPGLETTAGPLNWRNWKLYEREAPDAAALQRGFDAFIERSAELVPAIEARVNHMRADVARQGMLPTELWALREGTTPADMRALLRQVGEACQAPFAAALEAQSQAVFGRSAGPAELRAMYLNRMYDPARDLFEVDGAVEAAKEQFARIGFGLDHILVDTDLRERKYPGAFCLPVHIPGDVRVSVRVASAHHLVDMLYHEFGHAVHFAGIRPDLPYIDRYWIHSGTHETFSTLFEKLLNEPLFLGEAFGFDDAAIEQMVAFGRYKALLTGTWQAAVALAVFDAWHDGLAWAEVEARFAEHMRAFVGVAFPPAFARLEGFTPSMSVYTAGYVLAEVRVAHWLRHLRGLGGEAWWRSPEAQADIRRRLQAGGSVQFPPEWNDPGAFLADAAASSAATH